MCLVQDVHDLQRRDLGSNFDRPPVDVSTYEHLMVRDQNGLHIAVDNLYETGVEIIRGILRSWDCKFKNGVEPTNYIGDILGSLGGRPDFGPGVAGGVGEPAGGGNRTANRS